MPPPEPSRVFISYARKDAAELAQRLQSDLAKHGFDAWLDTQRISGGATWTTAIETALDQANYVVVLMTHGSYVSEICRSEQLRAMRKGTCVIPLKAQRDTDIPLHLEAKNYRDFSDSDLYDARFADLLADIKGNVSATLPARYRKTPIRYLTAPPRVANYLERPEALRALRDTLFAEDHRQPIALTAVHGMGGIGKTVLAKALTDDEVIRHAFPDGIVWITAGRERQRDFIADIREVAKAIGDDLSGYDNPLACENQYRATIANKAALIVVDDVWSKADIEPLLAESPRSRFLFTTRDAAIGHLVGARDHRADLLNDAQSRELLALWANQPFPELPAMADEIIRECGRLPLALSVLGGMLRGKNAPYWADTLARLRKADISSIKKQLPTGQETFFKAVETSFQSLDPEMQEQYKTLAVLLEDMPAPLPILATLWNVDTSDARLISNRLIELSLAQLEGATESIRLHDLQLDYVRAQYPDKEALDLIHGALRLSSNVIEKDPEQFASQMVGRLLPYKAKLAIAKLTSRVARSPRAAWLRPLQPALHPPGTALLRSLTGHTHPVNRVALSGDGRVAVSASRDQMLMLWDVCTGRQLRTLTGHTGKVDWVALNDDGRIAISASSDHTLIVWDLSSGRKIRTFSGDISGVRCASGDGRIAISASSDHTLRVWDLSSGREIRILSGHTRGVDCVALNDDGSIAVSASVDETVKVWEMGSGRELRAPEGNTGYFDGVALSAGARIAVFASYNQPLTMRDLSSGQEIRTLSGHEGYVNSVALSGDGRIAASASSDHTLKVWDLSGDPEIRTMSGHTSDVLGVALSADGRIAVSASQDHTLKVWDLSSARGPSVADSVSGHSGRISGVALRGDGRIAVSASKDRTMKVWDTASGHEIRTLSGHGGEVLGVALSAHGRIAVSVSDDQTLRVWEVDSGREIRTLSHYTHYDSVSLSEDGRIAVSASSDHTLEVWDLESGDMLRTLEGHSDSVFGVAVTPDGQRAVSASSDQTLKVWDLSSGRELRTLTGHSNWVTSVAVSQDGQQAISASWDQTLKVWELSSGRELRTLTGHTGPVSGVALGRDGRIAVSGSYDHTVKVWDLATGKRLATFTCDSAANCCAFSYALKLIVAGDAGGHLHFLRLEEPKPNI